jgi:hypothetical protein
VIDNLPPLIGEHNVICWGGPLHGRRLRLNPVTQILHDNATDSAYGAGGGDYMRTEELKDGLVVFRFVGNLNSRMAYSE